MRERRVTDDGMYVRDHIFWWDASIDFKEKADHGIVSFNKVKMV